VGEQVRGMQVRGQEEIDRESRELLAVHHTGCIAAEAGQRLYVQVKSGDSYPRKMQRDGAEVFQIKEARWADYWQRQA